MVIESTSEVLLSKTDIGLYISKCGGWHLDEDIENAVNVILQKALMVEMKWSDVLK